MNRLIRKPAWPEILSEYLRECQNKDFVRGHHDCALFAAEAVKRMTGVDLSEGFRGHYSDATGAAQILRANGGGTLFKTVTKLLGDPLENKLSAQRGDVAGMDEDEGPTLGICMGSNVALVAHDGGICHRPLVAAKFIWRV